MAEPYSIYKRSNGIYYVQLPYSPNGKVFQTAAEVLQFRIAGKENLLNINNIYYNVQCVEKKDCAL